MKLEHLMQAYKVNNINAELKESINEGEERAGVINFANQIDHTIKIIIIMQRTIMLLSNIPQKEANMILEHLGLFDNTFMKRKANKTFKS